jgi:hypothetical protein
MIINGRASHFTKRMSPTTPTRIKERMPRIMKRIFTTKPKIIIIMLIARAEKNASISKLLGYFSFILCHPENRVFNKVGMENRFEKNRKKFFQI